MIKLKLKTILENRDIRQKDFAETTGLRPATISEMCTNGRIMINKKNLEIVMRELEIDDFNEILVMKDEK